MNTQNLVHKKRIHVGAALLLGLFALLFFLLIGRFFFLQATGEAHGHDLSIEASERYNVNKKINASRGAILDRTGKPIAEDTPSFNLVAVLDKTMTTNKEKPRHVVDPKGTADKLASILETDSNELFERLSSDRKQVEFGAVGRDLPLSKKQEIEDLELPGIAFVENAKRFYFNGKFASHVIGFARADDEGEINGVSGLEKMLEEELKEQDGSLSVKTDNKGIKLSMNSDVSYVPAINGNNVYLTLDRTIQTFLEEAMNNVVKEYEPERIIAIVADPKTGKILGMGSRPTFDLNTREGLTDNWNNDAISNRFEPGSTMKIFSLAAAIEEGVYQGSELYQSGAYKLPNDPIPVYDHNRSGWGLISFEEGVQRSSNVAFALLAEKMGTDTLLEYIKSFGMDEPTGIDLPDEVTSSINYHYYRDRISTAFGQGSAFTPIQQIQAATAIANKGKMMQPYVIEKIVNPNTNQTVVENKPKAKGSPISENTASKVLEVLESVVSSENGTGRPYSIEGYSVAAKTGTAQIPGPGGYLSGHGEYIYSIIGMAPADDPELLMYVAVEKPKIAQHENGAGPVSGVFNSVMKRSLQYLSIKPDENQSLTPKKQNIGVKVPNLVGKSIQDVSSESQAPNYVVVGEGSKVLKQTPQAGQEVIKGEKIFLVTEESPSLPDMTGWSLRDVRKLANILELDTKIEGNGYVHQQSIMPGTPVEKGNQLVVELHSNRPLPEANEAEQSDDSSEEADEE
ncbi:penicillin-binding protein [Sutcliffiella rhizosphaerae]|uniref:serine-type D-Ala-D-Ala carboxypeptidase n=1 Tax=Sutcliffiella rhizosphaerae TaxID=2880967 RepID=A0ABM8YIS3_9BACI|nr:penicillin-binding protein [Sutcliffiella rhizosphaerae]CAG9619808.1 Penicillin-binding protein 2B [Sutcliffiella rhizosphaerae]